MEEQDSITSIPSSLNDLMRGIPQWQYIFIFERD